MKNLFFFFTVILFLLTGCKPDPIIENTYSVETTCDSNGYVSPTRLVVDEGGRARIAITPFAGCVVKSILVKKGNGAYVSVSLPENNILTLENVDSDIKVKVTIEKITEYYYISASSSLGGNITPSGMITVEKGKGKNFTTNGDAGYYIDSLIIDGKKMDVPAFASTYTFSYTANDTLFHLIRVVYKQKRVFTVTPILDGGSVASISGITNVLEGGSLTVGASTKELYDLVCVKVDGVTITGSSYTFTSITANHTFEVISKKAPEWYLCKITWINDSIYFDNGDHLYVPNREVLNFSTNGTYTRFWNNHTSSDKWSLDKKTNPNILTFGYGICTIEVLNDQKMIIKPNSGNIYVYRNGGYK